MTWVSVSLAQLQVAGQSDREAKLSSVLASVVEADMSAVFTEKIGENGQPEVKCSFRAKPGYDVGTLALALGGGGHPAASGCTVPGTLDCSDGTCRARSCRPHDASRHRSRVPELAGWRGVHWLAVLESPLHGLLIVDKPGWSDPARSLLDPDTQAYPVSSQRAAPLTSHDVVNQVRRWSGQRRIGHTGTLDPMASGVLLLCLGKATRLAEYYQGERKTYEAEIRAGTGHRHVRCAGGQSSPPHRCRT